MAVIDRTRAASLAASTPSRFLAAAGVVRQADRRAVEVEAAYAEAAAERQVADARAALVEEFIAVRGRWVEEMRVLAKAKRFDDAHPSRDPLYDELHAEQLYGPQYGEVA